MREAFKIEADIQTLTEKFSADLAVLTKELFKIIRRYKLEAEYPVPIIERDISTFWFTERVKNMLVNAKITTVAQLTEKTPIDLLKIASFGCKSLEEVRNVLAIQGLHLKGDV